MKVIGVDLGTTNSCVYYLDELGVPTLVMGSKQSKIFPSVVWAGKGGHEVVVGHAAKARIGQNPGPVTAVKRKMGTTETVPLGGQQSTPVEVSAHILRHAKRLVEAATQDVVGGIIITVPAYFDAAPKNDTYRAAVLAFFDGDEAMARGRIQLQLEPEAAAYAYAAEDPAEHLRVLVYDLGGGTFDVTILEKSRDTGLTVLKFGGDPHLGGDDVDDRVATWLLYLLRGGHPEALDRLLDPARYPADWRYRILQQVLSNDITGLGSDLRPEDRDLLIGRNPLYLLDLDHRNPVDMSRIQVLKRLAEVAKIDLTTAVTTVVAKQGAFEDQNGELVDIDLTLSRTDFERLIGDLIAVTLECTQQVLRESHTSPDSIDRVLLVGGSSRMPVVRDALRKVCDRPMLLADPDLIVARGAAIRARSLTPPPLGTRAGETGLTLEYPHETPEERVDVRGDLGQDRSGHAFLLQDKRDAADAPVSGGRFVFRNVRLQPNTPNRFKVEVVDEREQAIAELEFVIRHDERAIVGADRLAPKVTKPIRALGVRGYERLFIEGEALPRTKRFVCFRATQDDHIDIEFFEGERPLSTLHIADVDPRLHIGAPIDLDITVKETYAVSATAVVRDTKQTASVEFAITHLQIPPMEVMDQDFSKTLEQIENDLALVRDVNQRAVFAGRCQRLATDYAKARKSLAPDRHKLFSCIAELRTILTEIRAAQTGLEPSIEEFDGLVGICRGLVGRLPESGVMRREHVVEKIAHLEKAGRAAWDREDAVEWTHVTTELRNQHDQLRQAIEEGNGGGRRGPMPPLEIQRRLLGWLAEIRQRVDQHHLQERFGDEISATERAIRAQELRDEDRAREALLEILDRQVRPLDNRVEGAIKEAGGTPGAPRAKVYF